MVKKAADDAKKALDQIVREGSEQFETRKEQVKASEQYSWFKRLTTNQRFLIGAAVVVVLFLAVGALLRALLVV